MAAKENPLIDTTASLCEIGAGCGEIGAMNNEYEVAESSNVASNADGVLLGTVLPFSRDEGRSRESQFIFHTRFYLNSAMPAVSESIAKKGNRGQWVCFQKPFDPCSCGVPVISDASYWYCVQCIGKNSWDLNRPPYCRFCSSARLRMVRTVTTRNVAARVTLGLRATHREEFMGSQLFSLLPFLFRRQSTHG
jgi:hypothetical protein